MAVNNLIALKGPKDVSDSLRKVDRLKEKDAQNFRLSHTVELKLLRKQREAIHTNRVLLLLHANKMDQVEPRIFFCASIPTVHFFNCIVNGLSLPTSIVLLTY